ncbi:hypothetical protein DXN05_03570 [Deminuibacter soli]|uniref:Uncharacterized protein n=1 Tax=Deminuibacter soli TaxID=2291815 RepID=A0A3E1NQG9_9BACT|nr:hypothetical protein DXN05_03570 [Deminuibacter soli]
MYYHIVGAAFIVMCALVTIYLLVVPPYVTSSVIKNIKAMWFKICAFIALVAVVTVRMVFFLRKRDEPIQNDPTPVLHTHYHQQAIACLKLYMEAQTKPEKDFFAQRYAHLLQQICGHGVEHALKSNAWPIGDIYVPKAGPAIISSISNQ